MINSNDSWPFPTSKTISPPVILGSSPKLIFFDEVDSLEEPQINYVHINNHTFRSNNKPSLTLAYRQVVKNGKFIDVAIALCSNKDQFSKATGRELATARLERGAYITLPVKTKNQKELKDVVYSIGLGLLQDA